MRVTELKRKGSARPRVAVYIDGDFRLEAAAGVIQDLGWSVGRSVSSEDLRMLERAEQDHAAHEAALRLLSYRARSRSELESRLLQRDFGTDAVERCLAALENSGLVNDAAFAESFVRDRIRLRPRGRRGLQHELRRRGVDALTAEAAIDEVFELEEVDELQLATDLAHRWKRRTSPRAIRRAEAGDREARAKVRRRLRGFLARRGFAAEVVHAVVTANLDNDSRDHAR